MKLLFENWRRYLAEEEANIPHPEKYEQDKEAWERAYGPGGANQRAWLNKITRDTGLEGQDAINYYDQQIGPQVKAALETPLYTIPQDDPIGANAYFQPPDESMVDPKQYPLHAKARREDPAEFGSAMRGKLSKVSSEFAPKDFRTGEIYFRPESDADVAGHERSHALGHTVGEFQDIDLENEPILKKLFPQTDVERQKLAQPTLARVVPLDQQMKHYQGRAEQAASVRQLRRDLSLANPNWKEFTADDIGKLKHRGPRVRVDGAWWPPVGSPYSGLGADDIQQAIQQELDPELSDEEAADLLNQIVRNTSDPTNTKKA